MLDVIERLAALAAEDVVLEVGGGPGLLSQRLAQRAGFVHVVELDRSLEANLRGVLEPYANAQLHVGDALELDLASLAPAPSKMVANLPYGVAATVILRTIAELPSIQSWVVMVQREVGERFADKPGTPAYGVPSVLAQLECDVKVLRPVSRQVFRPVPNVDSVLLGLGRRGGKRPTPATTRLIHDAFRHRRKALAGSLQLSEPGIRERARASLVELGLPADVRAERLAPQQFAELAAKLYG
ncbi:MAG: ribosomal RNA small subunit methyltransferase A [Acidobacteriota bacterium]|nr:ribosomal RNA small subunit methyltransferase A [Acidobacteriota bacterium]